jgi:hypothetical protein
VSARVTGLQAALAAFAALLDCWRAQFSPHEYSVLLDLLARRLEHELERQERAPLDKPVDLLEREAV